jgi:hypothetical protein
MSKTHTYLITKKTKKMFIMFKTQLGKNWIFIFEKFLTIKNAALCLSFFFFKGGKFQNCLGEII